MARARAATFLLVAAAAFAATAFAQDAAIGVRSNPLRCKPTNLPDSCACSSVRPASPRRAGDPLPYLPQVSEALQRQLEAAVARSEELAKTLSEWELAAEVRLYHQQPTCCGRPLCHFPLQARPGLPDCSHAMHLV